MSVWLCMPSKRPPDEAGPIFDMWLKRGYHLALWLDSGGVGSPYYGQEFSIHGDKNGGYPGYAQAVNGLALGVLREFPDAQWIVCAGDDTEPDLVHSADEIAQDCRYHFEDVHGGNARHETFGVMQPTGDRWGDHRNTHQFTPRAGGKPELQMCSQCGRTKDNSIHMVGAYIDRVAGSPWMGREFCLRINQGRGPLWPEYFHMGCDEELQAVATRLGMFWQRPDLNQLHKHWGREAGKSNMPDFLKRANSAEEWTAYKRLFAERESLGFPGSEPL